VAINSKPRACLDRLTSTVLVCPREALLLIRGQATETNRCGGVRGGFAAARHSPLTTRHPRRAELILSSRRSARPDRTAASQKWEAQEPGSIHHTPHATRVSQSHETSRGSHRYRGTNHERGIEPRSHISVDPAARHVRLVAYERSSRSGRYHVVCRRCGWGGGAPCAGCGGARGVGRRGAASAGSDSRVEILNASSLPFSS